MTARIVRAKQPRRGRWVLLAIALVALLVNGCATFNQQYFIEVEERRPGFRRAHSHFIRLDLSGSAILTKSKFEKGWFDKQGVDSLFSTVIGQVSAGAAAAEPAAAPQPPASTPRAGSPQASPSSPSRRIRVFGPDGEETKVDGKRLVIFVTSNPNEVLTRIETTARTLETSEAFAQLLRRREIQEVQEADVALTMAGKRHEVLLVELESLDQWLEELEGAGSVGSKDLRRELAVILKKIDAVVTSK